MDSMKKEEVVAKLKGTNLNPLSRFRPYGSTESHDYPPTRRWATTVQGLTNRDIGDCIVRGFLRAGSDQFSDYGDTYGFNKRLDNDMYGYNDLYLLDLSKIDPVAVIQNAQCEIEKMMGSCQYDSLQYTTVGTNESECHKS